MCGCAAAEGLRALFFGFLTRTPRVASQRVVSARTNQYFETRSSQVLSGIPMQFVSPNVCLTSKSCPIFVIDVHPIEPTLPEVVCGLPLP